MSSPIHQRWLVNTYNAAGVSRRRDQNITNFVKYVNILEFGYYSWNPYEKYIQKSPNMPGIGSVIRKIDVNISEIWERNTLFLLSKTNARILSVNTLFVYLLSDLWLNWVQSGQISQWPVMTLPTIISWPSICLNLGTWFSFVWFCIPSIKGILCDFFILTLEQIIVYAPVTSLFPKYHMSKHSRTCVK